VPNHLYRIGLQKVAWSVVNAKVVQFVAQIHNIGLKEQVLLARSPALSILFALIDIEGQLAGNPILLDIDGWYHLVRYERVALCDFANEAKQLLGIEHLESGALQLSTTDRCNTLTVHMIQASLIV
jgi:hypothetical protein